MIRTFFQHLLPVFLAVVFVMWALQDIPPTQVSGIDVVTRVVQPSGDLHLRFQGTRHRACPVTSAEEIIDSKGRVFRVPSRLGNPNRETGPFDVPVHIQVPEEAAHGWATFRSIANYGVDPIHRCFRAYYIGPPERPEAKFWIGDKPPSWLTSQIATEKEASK